jgi:hypothetical protein
MPLIPLEEFLRLFPIRATSLAWFLGAGASASARLPTAGDLIWRFKRTLYCTSAKVDPRTCDDLGNEVVRARLQHYLNGTGKYPAANSPEEYASYFELTYPDPADRRRFIETMLHRATPAFGHQILAALMKVGKVRLVWTTNFDRLVEDAAAVTFGSTAALTVSTIDSSSVAMRGLNDGSWPLLGKLHGDFQSVALNNTTEELKTQKSALRATLIESCMRFGLIVAGYSGRDESVMNALEEAVSQPNAYPGGLFWFALAQLITDAMARLDTRRNEYDVLLIVLPDRWEYAFEGEEDGFDLHDHIKAINASRGTPTQFINEIGALDYRCRASVMWRLSIALYCKAGGVPWKLADTDPTAAFIGVSYALKLDPSGKITFVTCCSQVFDSDGAGLEFVAHETRDVHQDGDNPFLSRSEMRRIMARSLSLYQRRHGGQSPQKISVHKTTEFKEHEVEGCFDAFDSIAGVDLYRAHPYCGQ